MYFGGDDNDNRKYLADAGEDVVLLEQSYLHFITIFMELVNYIKNSNPLLLPSSHIV